MALGKEMPPVLYCVALRWRPVLPSLLHGVEDYAELGGRIVRVAEISSIYQDKMGKWYVSQANLLGSVLAQEFA